MRELDRIPTPLTSCAIVGAGRLGTALAAALRATGLEIDGPLGRGADPDGAGAVLLCVPDGEIAAAAAAVTPGVPVGHCSGATGLDVLAGHEAFGLHPLMTVTAGERLCPRRRSRRGYSPARARPSPARPRGRSRSPRSSPRGSACARRRSPTRTAPRTTPPPRSRRTSSSRSRAPPSGWRARPGSAASCWRRSCARRSRTGSGSAREDALTGPIARGDEATVARQRAAVAERAPDLIELYDALVGATRALAGVAR